MKEYIEFLILKFQLEFLGVHLFEDEYFKTDLRKK